jgi:hypothetical protein
MNRSSTNVSPPKQAGIPAADAEARIGKSEDARYPSKRYSNRVSARRANLVPSTVRGPQDRRLADETQVIALGNGDTFGPERDHGVGYQIERAVLALWITFLVGTGYPPARDSRTPRVDKDPQVGVPHFGFCYAE